MADNKKCKNPLCTETSPDFYKNRRLCKTCHNKQCVERRNRKSMGLSSKSVDKKSEIEDIRDAIKVLTERINNLDV